MGGEESKFCASKNNSSKKCITKLLKLGLREEEANHMYKLLGEQRFVPRSHIEVSMKPFLNFAYYKFHSNKFPIFDFRNYGTIC